MDVQAELGVPRTEGCQLVLQDVNTLHGSQFVKADCIVASPPCQEYSYMAMPFSRGKAVRKGLRGEGDFPQDWRGSRTVGELRTLFDACFRIQREASEAAGREIPLIVENVRGAQEWVGKAPCHFGSFYLWGDIPALMPQTWRAVKVPSPGSDSLIVGFQQQAKLMIEGYKSQGLNNWSDRSKRGQDFTRLAGWHAGGRDGRSHPRHLTAPSEHERILFRKIESVADGTKISGSGLGRVSSSSNYRKAASAQIAKIPFPLAQHIARCYYPRRSH